jgi:hypothetical protein
MAVTFDTLKYAKKLEQGGVDRHLAEAHTRALVKLLNAFNSYKIADQSNPENRLQAHKILTTSVLEYTEELIDANEKPKVSLVMAETLVKHLLN